MLAPEELLTCVSSGALQDGPWSVHLLQPLLTGVARVLRTAPLAAPSLLSIAAAIACGAPCRETVWPHITPCCLRGWQCNWPM